MERTALLYHGTPCCFVFCFRKKLFWSGDDHHWTKDLFIALLQYGTQKARGIKGTFLLKYDIKTTLGIQSWILLFIRFFEKQNIKNKKPMTIISSTSLGVCWFDLRLLISQSMLMSLKGRKIKCRGRCTNREKRGWGAKEKQKALWPIVTAGNTLLGWPQKYQS